MMNTIKLAVDSGIEYASFFLLSPIPGTKLYDIAIEKGWFEDKNREDYSDQSGFVQSLLKHPTMSAKEIEELHTLAHKMFYLRPKSILNLLKLSSPRLGIKAIQRMI